MFDGSRKASQIRAFVLVFLILLSAYKAAHITWLILQKKPSSDVLFSEPLDTRVFSQLNETQPPFPLFGATQTKIDSVPPVSANQGPNQPPLNLELQGVIKGVAKDSSLAIIKSKGSEFPKLYMVGDLIESQTRIKEIHANKVLVERFGKQEFLVLRVWTKQSSTLSKKGSSSDGKKIKNLGDGIHWQISQDFLSKKLEDISKLAREVQVGIAMKGDKQEGFRLLTQKEDSFLGKIGLKSGDTLLAVNGLQLTNASSGIKAYQKFRNAKEIHLSIKRNGLKKPLIYFIQ